MPTTTITLTEFNSGSEALKVFATALPTITESLASSESITAQAYASTDTSAAMQLSDMASQYARLRTSYVNAYLKILASVYYGGSTSTNIITGELDALLSGENISQLHIMRSINDVTAFLNQYTYPYLILQDLAKAYYRLNEAVGATSVLDMSAANGAGTVSGGVTFGQPNTIPGATTALFNGSTGYIALPSSINPAGWTQLAVEFRINLTGSFSGNPRIIANSHTGSDKLGFEVLINTGGTVTFSVGIGSAQAGANTTSALVAGTWSHILGVFDGSTVKIYFNGALQGSAFVGGSISSSGFPINIARNPAYSGDYTPATLADVAIYNRIFTATRANSHYQAISGITV